jgi:UDP-2,3-diacylglucosamine pyrophosphatase LpxH
MSVCKLVVSDLHLADGQPLFDGFGREQEAAWQRFLRAAAPGGPLADADEVELIIDGDCFDFLATPPYRTAGRSDVATALEKLEQIVTAHGAFFEALGSFVQAPGRRVTFVIGNHDLELCFPALQQRVRAALRPPAAETAVVFCPRPHYYALPDVLIEHGNLYDFWNHRTAGVWQASGEPLVPPAEPLLLSYGSWYYQEAEHLMHARYPYLDHLEPSLSYTRRMALLSLFDPELLRVVLERLMALLSQPRRALAGLAPGEEAHPRRLFEEAMQDLAAFQRDMQARKDDWQPVPGWDEERATRAMIEEYLQLRETLARATLPEALATIFAQEIAPLDQAVTVGMCSRLREQPGLRHALAGHTHAALVRPLENGSQIYVNIGTWTRRLARPTAAELTPGLIAWLRRPDWQQIPLRDLTRYTFALIRTTEPGQPATVRLCAWEDGSMGEYRVLA